jgi:hypothetical protein
MREKCMSSTRTEQLERFDAWGGIVMLVAGVALAGVAVYKTVFAFTSVEVSTIVDIGYGGLALVLTGVALLGLYPRVRDVSPKTAAIATVSSGLSVSFVIAVWGWLFGTTLQLGRVPVIPEEAPVWTVLALLGNFITLSAGFILFAVASRRTAAIPRSASRLLILPAFMWLGLIANIAINLIPNMSILVYVVNGITVGAIGYIIRGQENRTSSQVHATETPTSQGEAP